MADPILHIKDSYFFEVPRFLWRPQYHSLSDVPQFLVKAHPSSTPEEFTTAMAGKILIPQPFGTLKNLYEKESGFAISRFMIVETIVAILIIWLFKGLSDRVKAGEVPKGKGWNALEASLVFIRDEIAHPAIGHGYEKFVPYLWTVFFFILTLNLFGMIPWVGAATGAFAVTLTLGFMTFLVGLVYGTKKFGVAGFWLNMVPNLGLPWYAFPLTFGIFLIELLGTIIKHAILGVRLLANMVAGHLVLLAILGIIVTAAQASTATFMTASVLSVLGASILSVLELGVAFLQAYVFTFLSALFISAATHHH